MKTFVIGDIHGSYKGLMQCFKRSDFDCDKDKLICLGDVSDGWSQVPECINKLMKVKNLIYILGNHDMWLLDWFIYGEQPLIWTEQGGQATLNAYIHRKTDCWRDHREFLNKGHYKYIDDKNRIFVHGGFQRGIKLDSQTWQSFVWDRSLAEKAVSGYSNKNFRVKEFEEVFLGHTPVNSFPGLQQKHNIKLNTPIHSGNVWLMDTGGGWEGRITIMDVDSKEMWHSDISADLYPKELGRG